MGLTLADLMTPESIATIRARLVAGLTADGFPVANWAPSANGGVENLRLDFVSAGIGAFLPPRIAAFVNGRILPLASDDPVTGNYLTALGAKFYGLTKRAATYTVQNIGLYVAPASASVSYTFNPGDLWVRSTSSGRRYRSITGGALNGTNVWPNIPKIVPGQDFPLMLQFQAENPGSDYNLDGPGTISTMVTARAGVRCLNVSPSDFVPSPANCNGISTGTVVATLSGARPPVPSIRVQIVASGYVGSATFRFSTDGGDTWIFGGVAAPSVVVTDGSGLSAALAFANGTVTTLPSFVAGDIFTAVLGDPILQRGTDAETDTAFRRRCANRWPSLSDVPVAAKVDLWAHDASDEVDKVSVDADPNTSGGILVTIASSTGPASPAAQIAVGDYISARLWGYRGVPAPVPTVANPNPTSPAETVIVRSATAFDVLAGGIVRVPKAQIAQAQVTANNAWAVYLADLPLGGQQGAVAELAKLAQILADAGAIDMPGLYSTLTLNGTAADLVIPTGAVAVQSSTLLLSITWQPS
ncbi:MAG TPA: baseplate J/gp47 family protein [Polyangia bacterium]|nr:baseplate J/gp47 family protein [Polyangia bacterium]